MTRLEGHLLVQLTLFTLRVPQLLLEVVHSSHNSSQGILLLLQLFVGLLQMGLSFPQLLALGLNNLGNPESPDKCTISIHSTHVTSQHTITLKAFRVVVCIDKTR